MLPFFINWRNFCLSYRWHILWHIDGVCEGRFFFHYVKLHFSAFLLLVLDPFGLPNLFFDYGHLGSLIPVIISGTGVDDVSSSVACFLFRLINFGFFDRSFTVVWCMSEGFYIHTSLITLYFIKFDRSKVIYD